MAGVYVDTSALGRVLLAEPDAVTIRTALAGYDAWWASELLVVEFRRLAHREGLTQAAESLMRALRFVLVDSTSLQRASHIEPFEVRSLDAIHLEAAVGLHGRGDVVAVMTYDRQLQAGCAHHGIQVEAPTAV
jgi:predicted nucleic acid-binding protein